MKVFVFDYKGIFLGGKAVVLAPNERRARELIRDHRMTPTDYDPVTLKEVFDINNKSKVVYNWNGDY